MMSISVGICYDRPEDYPFAIGPADQFAEFEPESTIEAMEAAISILDLVPVRIGAPAELLERKYLDAVWNIAEGYGSRNREAWAPVLCEMHGIPLIGSDAHTLSVSLDKELSKRIAASLRIPTANWQITSTIPKADLIQLRYPILVKPNYEGTAKGIKTSSVCENYDLLKQQLETLLQDYRQPVLMEEFLPGPEYTLAFWGTPLKPLPILERSLHPSGLGSHVVPMESNYPEVQTFGLPPREMEQQMNDWCLRLYRYLNVNDYARIDFKCDRNGQPKFLELNPLPTFAVDNTFAIHAELLGKNYHEFLAEILEAALQRLPAL
jgi:D-alanine-D-alanine ligase